jgi:glycosyltransferase involved in cell wall biosynthesis
MVVVDTGSRDDTPGICERLGARVFHFPWVDDFATARNESLRYARGTWLFWMDSDDTIDADCGRRLRKLAYGAADSAILGYVVQVRCPGPTAAVGVTTSAASSG